MNKDELLAAATEAGFDVDGSETKAELEAMLSDDADVDSERICPNCGELHGSSFVPENEIDSLEGLKLSALEKADVYRVFRCGGRFHAVPHQESDAA